MAKNIYIIRASFLIGLPYARFLWGLSLTLKSHDQFPDMMIRFPDVASYWSTPEVFWIALVDRPHVEPNKTSTCSWLYLWIVSHAALKNKEVFQIELMDWPVYCSGLAKRRTLKTGSVPNWTLMLCLYSLTHAFILTCQERHCLLCVGFFLFVIRYLNMNIFVLK